LPRFTFGVECKLAFCGLLKPFGSSKKLCFFVRFASKKRRFFDNLTGFEPPRFEKSALFKKKPNKKTSALARSVHLLLPKAGCATVRFAFGEATAFVASPLAKRYSPPLPYRR
jgi:hypothetical protein